MREEYGLDDPLVVQYLHWLRGVVTGDLGTSYGMGHDISDEILRRLQPTLLITIGALHIKTRWPIILTKGSSRLCCLLLPRKILTDSDIRLGLVARAAHCLDRQAAVFNPYEENETMTASTGAVASCEEQAQRFLALYSSSSD